MDEKATKKMIAEVFQEVSEGMASGSFGKKVRIGLTTLGSEHGVAEMVRAAEMAASRYPDFEVVLIGPATESGLETAVAADSEDGHNKMVALLENGSLDGVVTQHFDFPIGVSTVGRVITPGRGRNMFIATTTGTTSTQRVAGMIKNAVSGVAVAKACGLEAPTVGILNVDGARQTERALAELAAGGYPLTFADSLRADGGAVMRGNDLLAGTPDVMVCDSLTGNLLIKMFSAFMTGGNYETLGAGYGPGIGAGYDKLINIVSRSSGAPLICEALRFCADCARARVLPLAAAEFRQAQAAGLDDIIAALTKRTGNQTQAATQMPAKKVVTFAIPGIDILELDDACQALWQQDIYSESGMGCTGPVILVNDADAEAAQVVLKSAGFKS